MASASPDIAPSSSSRRRSRLFGGIVLCIALAYIALPWLLPTSWLARRISQQLTESLQRPVNIGPVHVGWIDGIVVENITIGEQPGFVNDQLASIGQIRCGFNPLSTLLTGRVDRIELVNPQIWLTFDENGQLVNVADLQNQRAGSLPSLQYKITKAACHVLAPGAAAQDFIVDQVECTILPRKGQVRVQGWTVVPRSPTPAGPALAGHFSFDAKITIAKPDAGRTLGGQIGVEWSDLALTDLPHPLAARIPIQQLEGLTSGKLQITPQPDLTIDFALGINFNGVKIVRPGVPKPAQIPDAHVSTEGRWDPVTDKVVLQELAYETAALHIQRHKDLPAPALILDPHGSAPLMLHLAGSVKDWAAFRREFPEIDKFTGTADTNLTGSADFTLGITQEEGQDRLVATIDATPSRWLLRENDIDWLNADSGLHKSLHIEAIHNRQTRQVSQPQVLIQVGDLSLAMQSQLVLPATDNIDWSSWLAEALPTLASHLEIKTGHLEDIPKWLPCAKMLPELTACKGPLELALTLDPIENDSRIKLNVDLKPETAVQWGSLFAKTTGVPMSLQLAAGIPHSFTGEWHSLQFDLTSGTTHIHLIPERSSVECALSPSRDGHVALVLHVSPCEKCFPFIPLTQQWNLSDIITGSAELRLDSRFSFQPDNTCVTNTLAIKADNLKLGARDFVQKAAGAPLEIELIHRAQTTRDRLEQSFITTLHNPAGRFIVSTTLSDNEGFEHTIIEADIQDPASWYALSPVLAQQLEPYRLSGPFTFQADNLRLDGSQELSLDADLSAAHFTIPNDPPFEKSAGTPARLNLHLVSARDASSSQQKWQLRESSECQLATARTTKLSGEVIVQSAAASAPLSIECLWKHPFALPVFKSAAIQADGNLVINSQLTNLHPAIRGWVETYALAGEPRYSLVLNAKPSQLDVTGQIDAEPAAFTLNFANGVIPFMSKQPATPASLVFDVSVEKLPPASPNNYGIAVRNAKLLLDGNTLAAAGNANLRAHSPLALVDGTVTATANLAHPGALTSLLPGSTLAPLSGSSDATIKIEKHEDRAPSASAQIKFRNFALKTPTEPLHLDGNLTFDDQQIDLDQMHCDWGLSKGTATGHLTTQADQYTGRIGLAVDRLDLMDLQQKIAACFPATTPASTTSDGTADVRHVLDLLAHSNIVFDASANTAKAVLPLNVSVQLDAVNAHVTVENGAIDTNFRCLVDGGTVTGTVEARTDVSEPSYHLRYNADRIQPGPLVDRYLELTFPGMKATGPLTLIDESVQKIVPLNPDNNFPVGKGELIIEGGSVEGRAAPLWVTKIFPGLNMAKFDFLYMHSWFEKFPDGRVRHQMIFKGSFYNVYMDGFSYADGPIDYEIGIDFLADFNSRYWGEVGQGRVPLFNKTGRKMPDGKLADEAVNYLPPQRILDTLLIKNNPVFTAYHAVRKRVLREQ